MCTAGTRRCGRADGADALLCLGDLLLFVDYSDHGQGIFPDLFGAEAAGEFIALRTAQRFDEAREMFRRLWAGLDGDPAAHLEAAVSRQYEQLFARSRRLVPHLRQRRHPAAVGRAPAARASRAGRGAGGTRRLDIRFCRRRAAVALPDPQRGADDVYAAKVAAVGEVDVLCAHIPPAVPELLYDTVARRMERGSQALLEAVRRNGPRYLLFGHVHQPLARRVRIGDTECINVGHFRATGRPSCWIGSGRPAPVSGGRSGSPRARELLAGRHR